MHQQPPSGWQVIGAPHLEQQVCTVIPLTKYAAQDSPRRVFCRRKQMAELANFDLQYLQYWMTAMLA